MADSHDEHNRHDEHDSDVDELDSLVHQHQDTSDSDSDDYTGHADDPDDSDDTHPSSSAMDVAIPEIPDQDATALEQKAAENEWMIWTHQIAEQQNRTARITKKSWDALRDYLEKQDSMNAKLIEMLDNYYTLLKGIQQEPFKLTKKQKSSINPKEIKNVSKEYKT